MIKVRHFNNWPINLAPSREFDSRLRRPLTRRERKRVLERSSSQPLENRRLFETLYSIC